MRVTDPEKHQAKKQMILDAAKRCFAEQGFHQTSTAQICTEAQISTGSLFHYFPSKKSIIAALFEEDRQQTQELIATLREQDDLFAALNTFFDVVLDVAGDSILSALALEIAAEAGRDAETGALYRLNDKVMREELQYLISLGIERRQIAGAFPAVTAVNCLMIIVDGIFNRVALDPAFKPHEHQSALRAMLWGVLGHTADAGAKS